MSLEETPEPDFEASIAEFVTNLEFSDIPDEGVRTVERAFLDTLGVAVAGSIEPPGEIAAGHLEAGGSGGGEASVLGKGSTAGAPAAAFVNGTAAHALDFDDVSRSNIGHPSAPLIAAALAVGEVTDATGEDLLKAYVAGFEAASALAEPVHPGHYQAGWHSTGTFGTFSAAAAGAALLGLDTDRTRNALNIAASSPAGVQRNFGTMTKPMHAGQAARAGVTAALLASDGFTADSAAVTSEAGFYDLYSGPTGTDMSTIPDLGTEWAIVENGVQAKKYPCCYCTHAGIAATTELVERYDIEPEDVASIYATTSEKGRQILIHDEPTTGFQGKFSLPYTVASAIAFDRVDISTFTDEAVNDPGVQRVVQRTTFEADPSVPYTDYTTTVTVETVDGEQYEATRHDPPGRDGEPLSDEELAEKFRMCTERVLSEDAVSNASERLDSLREQDAGDVTEMVDSLTV